MRVESTVLHLPHHGRSESARSDKYMGEDVSLRNVKDVEHHANNLDLVKAFLDFEERESLTTKGETSP